MAIITIGKISGIKAFTNAEGKINRAMDPGIHASVHKSEKDYDRKKGRVRTADFR